jgi:hypothetical protein
MPAFNICCIDLRSAAAVSMANIAGPRRGGHIMHAATI